jgi:hypothetical protein
MKTAVEWLIEQIIKEKRLVDLDILAAKEMEREQMIDFACDVYDLNYCKDKSFRNAAEQCYNEIFKQEQ